jgi:hypothetical protein
MLSPLTNLLLIAVISSRLQALAEPNDSRMIRLVGEVLREM